MASNKFLEQAHFAEATERYDDMARFMSEFVKTSEDNLSSTERNLLSVAYKNVIGTKRSSYRVLSSNPSKPAEEGTEQLKSDYLKQIKTELDTVCEEVLSLLDMLISRLQDKDEDNEVVEAKVFYYKMKGDYLRYQAEVAVTCKAENVKELKDNSSAAYKKANECAKDLAATHPIRLGLALNYSVFYYEILENPQEACKLAKEAFDAAISDLDALKEDSYKDSTLIMQLLRDNLTLWTSDTKDDQEDS